jgi:hypothetical protein
MSGQWHGGKGSTPRPYSISQEEWDNRWDAIFQRDIKKEDNTGTDKNEYFDVLKTEDTFPEDKQFLQE